MLAKSGPAQQGATSIQSSNPAYAVAQLGNTNRGCRVYCFGSFENQHPAARKIFTKKETKMKKQIAYAAGLMLGATLITGCAPMLSASMNASLSDKAIVEKTASHFGVQPADILISDVKNEVLSTTYKTSYGKKLYNCSIYYGAVKCEFVREVNESAASTQTAAPQISQKAEQTNEAKEMTIAQAQARLNKLGYPVGKADGVMGNRTIEKLKLFQKSRGLPMTGLLDAPTVNALL